MQKGATKKQTTTMASSPVASTLTPSVNPSSSGQQSLTQIMDLLGQIRQEQSQGRQEQSEMRKEMHERFSVIDQQLNNFKARVQELDSQILLHESRLSDLETTAQSLYTGEMNLEMELAAKTIRIQNLSCEKDVDLQNFVVQTLAETIQWPEQELLRDIDVVYRQPTAYTRRQRLPPEVIVKFTRRLTRDAILKAARDKEIKINGNTVRILRDLPWKIRQARKEYSFLTSLLIQKNIQYRWIYPEGLSFQFEKKNIRLDTIGKAKQFAEQHAEILGYTPNDTERSISEEEEVGSEIPTDREEVQEQEQEATRVTKLETANSVGARPKRLLKQKTKKKRH